MAKAKPFNIPKREVWEAFKKVKANQGAAGVDGQCREPSWLENIELGAKKAIKRENSDPKYSQV